MAWKCLTVFNHMDIYTIHSGTFTRRYTDVTVETAGMLTSYIDEFSQSPQSSHNWTMINNGTPPKDFDSYLAIPKGDLTYNLAQIAYDLRLPINDSIVMGRHNKIGNQPQNMVGFKISGGTINANTYLVSAQIIFMYNSGWNTLTGTTATFVGGPDTYTRYHHSYISILANDANQQINIIWLHDAMFGTGTPGGNIYNQYGLTNANLQIFYNVLNDVFRANAVIPTDDPYPSNNYDDPVQGPGDFDDTSDIIDVPATPGLTVSSSRLVTIYTPSAEQIEALAERLIDPNILNALANTVEDISACIIGLHIIPLVVPYTVPDRQVCVNFMGISIGLGVYLNKAVGQFLDVDCGTLRANEYWGNCLDYSPYTRISIFLPFCGYYDIETDEVMGKDIHVKYRVDIASGSCIAFIIVNNSVLYQYTGNCSQQIPVTSVDFNSFLSNAFSVAVATATGGASVAAAGSAVMAADTAFAGSSGATVEERSNMLEASVKHYDAVKMRAEGRIAGSAVNAVVNSKPHFNHGGSLTGSSGFLGCKKPYLIITRPNPMIPDMYGKFHGYPCNTTATLSDLIGYTEVADIRLNIPDATVDEIIECEKLLKDGVVL